MDDTSVSSISTDCMFNTIDISQIRFTDFYGFTDFFPLTTQGILHLEWLKAWLPMVAFTVILSCYAYAKYIYPSCNSNRLFISLYTLYTLYTHVYPVTE